MICARCLTNLNSNDALGGSYGGVVCINHRICTDCWWNSDTLSIKKGNRNKESRLTRSIPLVSNPRQNMKIKCYGCLYNVPFIKKDLVKFNGSGLEDDPILII